MGSRKKQIGEGSGDIYIDLGFQPEEAAELNIKSLLFMSLHSALKESGLTQAQIAKRIGADQPKVSLIMNDKMEAFSIERIANYLMNFGYHVIVGTERATDDRGLVLLHRGRLSQESQRSKNSSAGRARE